MYNLLNAERQFRATGISSWKRGMGGLGGLGGTDLTGGGLPPDMGLPQDLGGGGDLGLGAETPPAGPGVGEAATIPNAPTAARIKKEAEEPAEMLPGLRLSSVEVDAVKKSGSSRPESWLRAVRAARNKGSIDG